MGLSGDASGHARSGTRSRFVLVCAPDAEGEIHAPESLRRALSARDAEVIIRTGAYEAMADLVEHERSVIARERREALVLLIVEPEAVAHAGELVAAAARYTPHAVCWRFGEHDQPQLRAFVRAPEGAPPESDAGPPGIAVRPGVAHVIAPRRPHIRAAPELRLTGEGDDIGPEGAEGNEGGSEAQRAILSDEELEMLLSEDWERQTGEGGPA